MASGAKDEFDAARELAAILEGVEEQKRHQVIRWALEKLGTPTDPLVPAQTLASLNREGTPLAVASASPSLSVDIKSFIDSKSPKSQSELVAAVAYFHQFEAPAGQRQDHIGEKELLDACRLAQRHRPGAPSQALVNASTAGLMDRVAKGRYRINSVGENLVAMVLPHKPGDGGKPAGVKKVRSKSKKSAKKA